MKFLIASGIVLLSLTSFVLLGYWVFGKITGSGTSSSTAGSTVATVATRVRSLAGSRGFVALIICVICVGVAMFWQSELLDLATATSDESYMYLLGTLVLYAFFMASRGQRWLLNIMIVATLIGIAFMMLTSRSEKIGAEENRQRAEAVQRCYNDATQCEWKIIRSTCVKRDCATGSKRSGSLIARVIAFEPDSVLDYTMYSASGHRVLGTTRTIWDGNVYKGRYINNPSGESGAMKCAVIGESHTSGFTCYWDDGADVGVHNLLLR